MQAPPAPIRPGQTRLTCLVGERVFRSRIGIGPRLPRYRGKNALRLLDGRLPVLSHGHQPPNLRREHAPHTLKTIDPVHPFRQANYRLSGVRLGVQCHPCPGVTRGPRGARVSSSRPPPRSARHRSRAGGPVMRRHLPAAGAQALQRRGETLPRPVERPVPTARDLPRPASAAARPPRSPACTWAWPTPTWWPTSTVRRTTWWCSSRRGSTGSRQVPGRCWSTAGAHT
jgi:hypothetical protein